MGKELAVNGVNSDGSPLTEGVTTDMIAKVARGQTLSKEDQKDLKMKKAQSAAKTDHFGVAEGIDSNNLAEAGWSVIFPADYPQKSLDAIKEALKPLLDHRKAQAAANNETFYKEVSGTTGYKNGESKNDFLKRFGRGPGPADPEKFPYYAMIVGSPETIPFSFQYQLDVQYAVGRIYFEKLEDYYQYATSVVQAETKKLSRGKKAAFFGVGNPDDKATGMSSENLIKPLYEEFKKTYEKDKWDSKIISPEQATKANLANFIGGADSPSLLFTASHGMSFKQGDAKLLRHQGALLCQDWPGPKARKPITEDMYFSADDIPADADLFGMFAFLFACYGGGTPKMDNFYRQAFGEQKAIAPYSFIAQLPLRMLSHPKGGALAVFAHVERAWGSSIMWDGSVREIETFDSTIDALMNGKTAGVATEYFNERYAEISSDLTSELDNTTPETQDDVKIAGMWTSNNDARNYALLGDPAVRLAVGDKETAKTERATLGAIASQYPATVIGASGEFQPDVVVRTAAVKTEATGSTENFGVADLFKKVDSAEGGAVSGGISESLKKFVDKLGEYLSKALEDATTLEISTYVADDLATLQYQSGKFVGARLRASTRVNIDGDTLNVVPEKDGEVDTAVWSIHLDMVKQAQNNRNELMKTIVGAASGIVGILPK